MMLRGWLVACVIVATSCVKANSETCGFGVCPETTVCDSKHDRCVDPRQLTACDALDDGAPCSAGPLAGVCDQSVCLEGCGDGITQANEECDCGVDATVLAAGCDAPNGDAASSCATTCVLKRCGDGIVQPGEACDDSNVLDGDGCGLACTSLEVCGNGLTDFAVGELCDDGDFESHDGCSSTCLSESPTWVQWEPESIGRVFAGTAYDTNRQKLVLVGGRKGTTELGDTWERDGTIGGAWTHVAATLPPRAEMAIAFDDARNVVVVFGGTTSTSMATNETWEYNGTSWTQKSLTASPPARTGASMVWDPVRGHVVVFGGANASSTPLGDMWEFTGTTWTQITPANGGPAARYNASMTHTGDRIVVFGGITAANVNEDTWELVDSNLTWTQYASATTHPAPRYAAAMSYDALRSHAVLFGGTFDNASYSDTWVYSTSSHTWQSASSQTNPRARAAHSMVYDPDISSVLLVAGAPYNGEPIDDFWTYGSQWSEDSPRFSPSPRAGSPLVYDAARKEIVMFGGAGVFFDTWVFDGQKWIERIPSTYPPGRADHMLAYDEDRQRVVMYGGVFASFFDDVWEWNGTDWASKGPGPSARYAAAMAYDAHDHVTVLYGGIDAGGTTLSETWEYNGTTWTQITGAHPPAMSRGRLAFDRATDRLVLVGPDGEATTTWTYQNHAWTQLQTTVIPPGRANAVVAYVPSRGRIVLAGGGDDLADQWELDPSVPTWVNIGSSPARTWAGGAAHEKSRTVVMFGGSAGLGNHDDTWLFQYRSNTDDETCANGFDADGDGLTACADPDCAPVCP